MAEALIQKIEDNFLSCCVCFDQLKDPIGLPCLHAFCFKCLDRWFQSRPEKTKVICPTCKASFPNPKEGIRGFPGHFMLKNIKETVDSEKKGKNCNLCEKKADKHCIDCKKSLCHACLRNHDAFTTDHKVVTIEEYQSGQVTDEGRFCQVHGKKVMYYCETEERGVCNDCVGLKTCSNDHHRVTVKEAAEKRRSLLQDKAKKCRETQAKLQDARDKTKAVQVNLKKSKTQSIAEIEMLEHEYITRVRQAFQSKKEAVNKIERERNVEIDDKLKAIELELGQIESACDQVSKVQSSTSEYLVTHKYQTLSTTLAILSQSQPVATDTQLGHMRFEPAKMVVPSIGQVVQSMGVSKRWKLGRTFVAKDLNRLAGIVTNENGDVVVCSWEKGLKLYTGKGQLKSTVYDSNGVVDVAILPHNRCVFQPLGITSIQCSDMQGNQLFTVPIRDVNNKASNVNSVAVDSKGRIIVGQVDNTISIHQADGSLISKFATESTPMRLAVTSDEEIVTSYYDHDLKHGTSVVLMDYSGGNIRVIQPPDEVKVWRPDFVCCGHGEIFVVNNWKGDPTGVYRFTSEGNYLGCITTEVNVPTGVTLSKDGMELYVAEHNECVIKIFTRIK